jgi:hypothetical protein
MTSVNGEGEGDDRRGELRGTVALGTLINVGVSTTEEPQLTYGGMDTISRDPVDASMTDGVQRRGNGFVSLFFDLRAGDPTDDRGWS